MLEVIEQHLKDKFKSTILEVGNVASGKYFKVSDTALLDVAKVLRDQFGFKVLQVISGVDYKEHLEVNYIISNFSEKELTDIILKVKLPRENPSVESLSTVWTSANWQERECFDMIGVNFKNHPDLRRILCPDDWEGFPLRKDYVAAEKYRHMTIYPPDKLNLAERQFAEIQKQNPSAQRPELSWE